MANTLGGVNLAAIAEASLTALQSKMIPVSRFTTDFSSEIRSKGESVTTRVPTAPVAQDLTSGYAPSNSVTTAKTVTLNLFKGYVTGFTDLETSKSSIDLQRLFIQPAVKATVLAMLNDLFALITNANFSQKVTKTAAQFDADVVADMSQVLDDAFVDAADRTLVVEPSHFTSLAKDNAIQASYAYGGSEAIRNNMIPSVHGFGVVNYPSIPSNSENLVGFGSTREALLIAARAVEIPQNFPGQCLNTVEPVSGLPLQFRYWYNPDAASQPGSHNFSVGVLYGVSVGVAGNLVRVVTA